MHACSQVVSLITSCNMAGRRDRAYWSHAPRFDHPKPRIIKRCAVFEAVHGSAPDIAGKGVANPLALLMSAVMMLNHLADSQGDLQCSEVAKKLKAAYDRALADGCKTRDLGGELATEPFADAVIERL